VRSKTRSCKLELFPLAWITFTKSSRGDRRRFPATSFSGRLDQPILKVDR
jgi:hypothetical protein